MRKFLYSMFLALLSCGMLSCSKQTAPDASGTTLSIHWEVPLTKAASLSGERLVNSLVFYVFDTNGRLDISHTCSSSELSEARAKINLKTGRKTVWAVANLTGEPLAKAQACTTVDELRGVAFQLSSNAPGSFVMTACTEVDLIATGTPPCTLNLTRMAARVALGTVTNSLPAPYGSVKLQRAFLCNVAGNQNIAGDAEPSGWINPEGTPDGKGKTHTIGQGGFQAQVPQLTCVDLGEVVSPGAPQSYPTSAESGKYLYAFANPLKAVNNGYTNPFSPTATVLMLVVQIKNVEYYYPVPLKNGLGRNTDNIVNVTLVGLGNTLEEGPFNKIEKADLTASVIVSDWSNGSTYTEKI